MYLYEIFIRSLYLSTCVTLRNVKRVILQIAYVVGGIKVVRQN